MSSKFVRKTAVFFICLDFAFLVFGASVCRIKAQEDAKRQVAVVADNEGKTRIIRYSDLLFQLALQPHTPLNPPRTEDLKRALRNLIDMSLISMEFENRKFPEGSSPLCRQASREEIDLEIKRMASLFRYSTSEFEKRLREIGFSSIRDENFEREIGFRVTMQKWLDLRFRSFMIITPEEEAAYYRDVFAPEFRRRYPGLLMPDLQKQSPRIRQILTEQKAEVEINKYLEFAGKRVKIDILSDELK